MKEVLKDIKLGQIIGIYHFEDSCFTVGKILKISSKYLFLLSYDINFKEEGIKVFLIASIKRIILKSDYIQNLEKNQKKIFKFNSEDNDLFQELIKNKTELSIDLADGSIENVYLTEKDKNYFSFQMLDDSKNVKIITTRDNKESMAYDLFYYENYLIFSEKEEFYDISKINIISKNKIENISDIEIKLDIKKENFYNLIDFEKELEIIKILRKCLENKFLVFIDNEDFFETKIGIIIELEDEKLKIEEIDKYGNFNKSSEIYFDEIQLLAVKNYRLGEK